MTWVVVAGVAVASGVWLIVAAIWPAPRPLSGALGRLHAVGRPRDERPDAASEPSLPIVVGTWMLRRLRRGAFTDEALLADLAILRRPPELIAGVTALSVVGGALAGPAIWVLANAAGSPLPWLVPLWLIVVGAAMGYLVPRLVLRSQAAAARRDFRHALGAYLDVLVLLLAAHEGPESAMDLAARAGHGPAFDELRRATFRARLSGDAVWTALDELGARIRVPELREIAGAGTLAGESGAAVRKSLTAKARALRAASLSAAEAAARKQSQAMFAPLVVMGIGFILFLLYPLVTNLSVGR